MFTTTTLLSEWRAGPERSQTPGAPFTAGRECRQYSATRWWCVFIEGHVCAPPLVGIESESTAAHARAQQPVSSLSYCDACAFTHQDASGTYSFFSLACLQQRRTSGGSYRMHRRRARAVSDPSGLHPPAYARASDTSEYADSLYTFGKEQRLNPGFSVPFASSVSTHTRVHETYNTHTVAIQQSSCVFAIKPPAEDPPYIHLSTHTQITIESSRI